MYRLKINSKNTENLAPSGDERCAVHGTKLHLFGKLTITIEVLVFSGIFYDRSLFGSEGNTTGSRMGSWFDKIDFFKSLLIETNAVSDLKTARCRIIN